MDRHLAKLFTLRLQCNVSEASKAVRERVKRICLLSVLGASLTGAAGGQVAPGAPNFSAYDSHEVDTVNLMNNNVTLNIPVMSKSGTLPFNFALSGNYGLYPFHTINNVYWKPYGLSLLGSTSLISFEAYDSFTSTTGIACPLSGTTTKYTNWYITSPDGTLHPLPTTVYADSAGCLTGSGFTATTIDNSGLTAVVTAGGSVTSISTRNGLLFKPSAYQIQDAQSTPNKITYDINTSPSTYTDSMGLTNPVLSETVVPSLTYTWTDVNGGSPSVGISTTSLTTKSLFGCSGTSGVGEEQPGPFGFPTGISFPDGTSMSLSYELTPGYAPDVTGRISQIGLREGGTINYSYGAGTSTIDCFHQDSPNLTRTLGNGDVTTYSLAYSLISGANYKAVNEVVDPGGNHTLYQFTGFTSGGNAAFPTAQVLTQVKKYQGAASGTPLTIDVYCYNTVFSSCSTSTAPNATVTYPVTSLIVFHQVSGRSDWSATETDYDGYGNVKYTAAYDFGGTLKGTMTITYGSCTASCNTASPTISNTSMAANHIYDRPGMVVSTLNGNTVSQSNYVYSSVGNLLTTYAWTGSTWLSNSTANAYNANGTPTYTYDFAGVSTHYLYDSTKYSDGCSGATQYPFPTSVTKGGLTTSATYDCTGGVKLTDTDTNGIGNTTTYGYVHTGGNADPYWRVSSIADPYNAVVYQGYPSSFQPNAAESLFNFNSGSSTEDNWGIRDSYGRVADVQKKQSPSGNFDTVSTAYGWSGNYRSVASSQPCSATWSGSCPTTAHTSLYDPLARLHTSSTTSNEIITHTYTQNDDLLALTPVPAGEFLKQTQTEYDGLGRVKSVCQIFHAGGGYSCGQVNGAYSGIVDAYSYSSASGSTTVSVTRNGTQTRSITYDALGRMTQKVTPEGGTWTYYYDRSVSGCLSSGNFPGKLTCVKDANNNEIVYLYDSLGRPSDIGAGPWGTTSACKRFRYDNTVGVLGALPTGVTLTNQYGRLVEAETDDCVHYGTAALTDEWFAYDKDGRQTDIWESTPHSTQYYHSVATFFENGKPKTVQLASPSLYTMTYTLDGEGRWNSLTDTTTSKTLVYSTTINPDGQPASINLIAAGQDNDAYTYDPNTGRMTNYTFTVGATPATLSGTLTWNPNGTLARLATVDGFNAGGTLTCVSDSTSALGYGYDDLLRLRSFDCGSGNWGQQFTYDAYDNLSKSVLSGRSGTSWNPTYDATNHYGCGLSCTHDANGNVTNDSTNTYQWDEFSKMKSSASSGIPTCGSGGKCITYDAFGRIVETSAGSTWKEYWYPQVGQVQLSGTTPNFAYFPTPAGGTEVILASGTPYYYMHKDWIGNARILSNLGRTVITDQAYTPYGEVFANFGSNSPAYDLFAGITANFNNGVTYDTPNRELSIVGRWLSPDPAGAGWNQYAYPTNPNSLNDPTGLNSEHCGRWCEKTPDALSGLSNSNPAWGLFSTEIATFGFALAIVTVPTGQTVVQANDNNFFNGGAGLVTTTIDNSYQGEDLGSPQEILAAANNQPNPWVTAATDALGIASLAASEKAGKVLGPLIAAASIKNDPSNTMNWVTNLLGFVKGLEAPTAISSAFVDAFDYGVNNSNGRIDNGANLIPATISNGEVSIPNPALVPCEGWCN